MIAKAAGGAGIATILAALGYIFTLLSNPAYLSALLVAIQTHSDPEDAIVKLTAAVIGLIGAIIVTCVGFWLSHSPLAGYVVTETTTTKVEGP